MSTERNTSRLRFWVTVAKINESETGMERRWKFRIGRLECSYRRRPKSMLMGRFGAGWNWKLGVSIGGNTAIFDLLIASIRVAWVAVPKTVAA